MAGITDRDDAPTRIRDHIRTALGAEAEVIIESVELPSKTAHNDLPDSAMRRLGTVDGQANVLLRITCPGRSFDPVRSATGVQLPAGVPS